MILKSALIFSVLQILIITGFADESNGVLVQLPYGSIFGRKDESYSGTPYYSFQKIPYAAPPVGELRFKAPVPPDPWTEVLNATYLDKICYQTTTNLPEESEDCLYINVYTPDLPTTQDTDLAIPVLLYIYGGGFTEGHAMTYRRGPEYLIDYDIVVVTFNYRLGPFGFISTGDEVIPGNNGLKDQQLAIKWVHDNIHLFGGDRDKVTIIGESAGGSSVHFQLLNENSEGLFRAAVMESGTAINAVGIQTNPRETAFRLGSLFDDRFSDSDDSESLLDYLLTVSAEDLDSASAQVSGWVPVIEMEHDDAFITEKRYGLVKSGRFVQVPTLMGINSEESLYSAADLDALKDQMEYYDNNLEDLVPGDLSVLLTEEEVAEYGEEIRDLYCGNETFAEHLAAGVRFQSDTSFNRAIIKCAELMSAFTDVYFYQFSYDGPMGNVTISIEGADHVAHAEELRYIWRTTREGYDNSDLSKYPAEDALAQHRMLTLWTNFVKTLNPTPETVDLLQNVTWPTIDFGDEGDFLYIDIGENLEIKNHPKGETYSKWVELYERTGYDDYDTY